MRVESTAFSDHASIPALYTSDGKNISPPLSVADVPKDAKSLALIVDDPDAPDPRAPKRVWVHWVMYNLPPNTTKLREGANRAETPAFDGKNDWGKTGYGGPAPPIGEHRYFHRLYALDTVLPDLGSPTRAELENAMKGHVIAEAELIGTYQKAS